MISSKVTQNVSKWTIKNCIFFQKIQNFVNPVLCLGGGFWEPCSVWYGLGEHLHRGCQRFAAPVSPLALRGACGGKCGRSAQVTVYIFVYQFLFANICWKCSKSRCCGSGSDPNCERKSDLDPIIGLHRKLSAKRLLNQKTFGINFQRFSKVLILRFFRCC